MLQLFSSCSNLNPLASKKQNLKHPSGLVCSTWCKLRMFFHSATWHSDRALGSSFYTRLSLKSQHDLLKPQRKYFVKQMWLCHNKGRTSPSCRNTFSSSNADSRREMLQRAQATGLIPYLLSGTWETVSGGKVEFYKSLGEAPVYQCEPSDHPQKLSGSLGCAPYTKHANDMSLTDTMLLLLSHIWYFWNSPLWESFWHKADFCRSVTYSWGRAASPSYLLAPYIWSTALPARSWQPEEGSLCHGAVEQPHSMPCSKVPILQIQSLPKC